VRASNGSARSKKALAGYFTGGAGTGNALLGKKLSWPAAGPAPSPLLRALGARARLRGKDTHYFPLVFGVQGTPSADVGVAAGMSAQRTDLPEPITNFQPQTADRNQRRREYGVGS
jgi:hypothetical protein